MLTQLGQIRDTAPKYSLLTKTKARFILHHIMYIPPLYAPPPPPSLPPSPQVLTGMLYKIFFIDRLVEQFTVHFNQTYSNALATDFYSMPLTEQAEYVKMLYKVSVRTLFQ